MISDRVAKQLSEIGQAFELTLSDDPTVDLLKGLALAFIAFEALNATGAPVTLEGRLLVRDAILRAFREGIIIRSKIDPRDLDLEILSIYGYRRE